MRGLITLFVLLSVAACTDNPVDPTPGDALAGVWTYSAPTLTAPGFGECRIVNGTLDINRRDPSSDGILTGTFECREPGGDWQSGPFGPYRIIVDSTEGDNVRFTDTTGILPHEGLLAGDSMAGTFEIRDIAVTFQGSFVATRR